MSEFVFGFAHTAGSITEGYCIAKALKSEAAIEGFNVFVDEQIPQETVTSMITEHLGQGTLLCSFLVTAHSSEDTSASMVSPFECAPNEICKALASLEAWAERVLRTKPEITLSLFITDGYDIEFRLLDAPIPGWGMTLAQLIENEGGILSTRIDLRHLHLRSLTWE